MALLRVVHASSLPDPGELARKIADGEVTTPVASTTASAATPAASAPADFAALVQQLHDRGERDLAHRLHDFVGLVRYEPPLLVIRPNRPQSNEFVRDVAAALKRTTGEAWQVETSDGEAEPSLYEGQQAATRAERESVLAAPVVAAALEAFPDAELLDYELADKRSIER